MPTFIEKACSLPDWAAEWLDGDYVDYAFPLGKNDKRISYHYEKEELIFNSMEAGVEDYIDYESTSQIDLAVAMANHWSQCKYNPEAYETEEISSVHRKMLSENSKSSLYDPGWLKNEDVFEMSWEELATLPIDYFSATDPNADISLEVFSINNRLYVSLTNTDLDSMTICISKRTSLEYIRSIISHIIASSLTKIDE